MPSHVMAAGPQHTLTGSHSIAPPGIMPLVKALSPSLAGDNSKAGATDLRRAWVKASGVSTHSSIPCRTDTGRVYVCYRYVSGRWPDVSKYQRKYHGCVFARTCVYYTIPSRAGAGQEQLTLMYRKHPLKHYPHHGEGRSTRTEGCRTPEG